MMRNVGRALVGAIAAVSVIGVVFLAGPAEAGEKSESSDTSEQIILLQGDATVTSDQQVENVYVGRGTVTIEGSVNGDVVVIDGGATVSGTVDGSVIVFRGTTKVTESGMVSGDVASQKLEIDPGAVISGEQTDLETSVGAIIDSSRQALSALLDRLGFFFWLSSSVSYLLLGLLLVWLAPTAFHRSAATARRLFGESIAWGVGLVTVLPVACALLILSGVGFPFGVGLFLALFLAYALGHVVAAAAIGQAVARQHDGLLIPFLIGWAILRLVALIPIAGIIIWALSAVYGLGVIAMTAQQARGEALSRSRASA